MTPSDGHSKRPANELCPAPELLVQLADGGLPGDLESRLIDHLDRCGSCRQRLDLQTPAEFADYLPELRTASGDSPLLRATLDKVKSEQNPWSLTNDNVPVSEADHRDALHWTEDGFELIQLIGRGGMGIVFQAREVSLDRIVAIKVLAPSFGADEAARQRFLREARAAAGIKHANVITIHAVAEATRLPYLIMEYVEGQSLQERLDECGRLDAGEVVRIGSQIAAGLAAAHTKGIVHRDVKPANILLEAQTGQVKLSDFGLARVAGQSQLTQTGMLVGTPAFVAPELLDETREPDHRADLFSFGSVLYAMCSGEPPFEAGSLLATLHRISTAQPTPISQRVPTIQPRLAAIINKLHAKNPDARFQSAGEVQDALQAESRPGTLIPAPPPVVAPPPRSIAVRAEHRRRRPPPSQLWPVAIAVAGLALALLTWLAARPDSRPALPATPPSPERQASVVEQPPVRPPVPSLGAIVVLSADGRHVDTFDSLEEALQEAPDDVRIELHANGPLVLSETDVEQDSITIAAGEGYLPVIAFLPGEENDESALFSTEGDLRLEGLELRYATGQDDPENRFLVRVAEGSFLADRCLLTVAPAGCCVVSDFAEEVVLTNCELHASEGCAIELISGDSDEARLENCFLSGQVAVQFTAEGACNLQLQQCTLVAPQVFELFSEEGDDGPEGSLTVTAARSLFKSRDGLISVADPTLASAELANGLRWRGSTNVYSGPFVILGEDESQVSPSWGRDFEGWQTIGVESRSTYTTEPFLVGDEDLWEAVLESRRARAADLRTSPAVDALEAVVGARLPGRIP